MRGRVFPSRDIYFFILDFFQDTLPYRVKCMVSNLSQPAGPSKAIRLKFKLNSRVGFAFVPKYTLDITNYVEAVQHFYFIIPSRRIKELSFCLKIDNRLCCLSIADISNVLQ